MKSNLAMRTGMAVVVIALASMVGQAQFAAPAPGAPAAAGSALSIPQAQLLQPEALNRLLAAAGAEKPLVLQIGSHVLFAQAHIPGAEYAGPGSQPAGLEALESRVTSLPRTTFIVLYCGCCPWIRCPNIEPALTKLRQMGFTNVKALYLADNFGANWRDKGYAVEQGR